MTPDLPRLEASRFHELGTSGVSFGAVFPPAAPAAVWLTIRLARGRVATPAGGAPVTRARDHEAAVAVTVYVAVAVTVHRDRARSRDRDRCEPGERPRARHFAAAPCASPVLAVGSYFAVAC
jgi:hypothetical protein